MSILSNSTNHFLSSLSAQDAELLQPHIKLVELPTAAILYKADEAITRVYFPYIGFVSFIVGVATGESVEAGVIGRNSVIGVGALLNGGVAINEAIIQMAMTGAAVEVGVLKRLVSESELLRIACARHEEMALGQAQQVAACNALHTIEQRLARWLLQARDLLNDHIVPLTQDSLSQMLGVNRSSVTLAAGRLQEAGLIDYHRGHIRLLDVEALSDVSCECYAAINALSRRLIGWSPNRTLGMTDATTNGKPQPRNDELRGAAFHEAGHAVVACFYGLAMGEIPIGIGDDDVNGRTQIGLDDHLPLVDRIALCMAGVAAQKLFNSPSREWLGMADYVKVGELVANLGHAESLEVRLFGYQRACEILRRHGPDVRHLAGRLIEQRCIVIAEGKPRRGGQPGRSNAGVAMMAGPPRAPAPAVIAIRRPSHQTRKRIVR